MPDQGAAVSGHSGLADRCNCVIIRPFKCRLDKGYPVLSKLQNTLPDYMTIERRKVKWARIEVRPTGEVRIVVPHSYRPGDIAQLMSEKQRWIDDKRAKALLRPQVSLGVKTDELLLFGRGFQVLHDASQQKTVRVDQQAASLHSAKNLLDKDQQRLWYREFAKQYLSLRIVQLAQQHGFEFNRLFIREQKTRWGSCSSQRNISLNWKLIKAPVFVSDYVILHELVHTRIMNHSPAFWQRVAIVAPDYQDAKQWLRSYSPLL